MDKVIAIDKKHKGKDIVIKALVTRLSNKEQKEDWAEIERRKKLEIIVGTI